MSGFFPNTDALACALAAAAAGFAGDVLPIAVAIAGAESSWNPKAMHKGDNPAGWTGPDCTSYGLWQINHCPGRDDNNANRGADKPDELLNPVVNARAAFAISSGGANFAGPWAGSYGRGAHLKYLDDANKAVAFLNARPDRDAIVAKVAATNQLPTDSGGGGGGIHIPGTNWDVPNPLDVAKSVAGAIPNPLDWAASLAKLVGFVIDPKNWLRVFAGLAGIALVIAGLAVLIVDNSPPALKQAGTQAATAAALA